MKLKVVMAHGLAVATLVALVVGQASPAAAVTFDYSQSTGFVMGTSDTDTGFPVSGQPATTMSGVEFFQPSVNPNPLLHPGDFLPPADTFTTIGWGCGLSGLNCPGPDETLAVIDPKLNPNRSSLFALGQAGTVNDDGVFVTITHLEHKNQAVTGRTLSEVRIDSILRIGTAPDPTSDSDSIVISFRETLNGGGCGESANPLGSICDDFFTFDLSNFEDLVIFDNGIAYNVTFQLANFEPGSFQVNADGTGTLFTREGSTNSVDVQMAISPRAVPEPATLMLLGAGLIGVGFAAAKRRRNKI